MEIRQFLTDLIGTGGIAKELEASLRAMRAACQARLHSWQARRKFLEDLGPLNWHGGYGGLDDYLLNQALGALPGVFGIHVGQLAVRYGIDVEDRLASLLPPPTRNLDKHLKLAVRVHDDPASRRRRKGDRPNAIAATPGGHASGPRRCRGPGWWLERGQGSAWTTSKVLSAVPPAPVACTARCAVSGSGP